MHPGAHWRSIVLRLVIATAVSGGRLCAQDATIPMGLMPIDLSRTTNLNFERLLNTLSWTGALRFDRQTDAWSVTLDQHYRARLIRGLQESHQNEYSGTIQVAVPLAQRWNGIVSNASMINLDERARELGTTIQHRLLAGAEIRVAEGIAGMVQGGFEMNEQGAARDRGGAYRLRMEGKNVEWDEFVMNFGGEWTESLLGVRRPHTGDARIALWRKFSETASDSLTVDISSQKRSFYIAADDGVRSAYGVTQNLLDRSALGWQIQNRLQYRPEGDFALSIDAMIANRSIDRGNRYRVSGTLPAIADARVQELQLSAAAQVDWMVAEGWRINSAFSHHVREERHSTSPEPDLSPSQLLQQQALARRLENIAGRTSAWIGTDVDVSDADRLQLRSSATILRYDTPDTLNVDDRDELYLTVGLEWGHRFNPLLLASLALDLSGTHLVYLSRLQSANNTWNRVIRLGGRVEYRQQTKFANVLRAEVIGNYTVSDYEEQVAAVRSFSFRQAAWSDSLVWRITPVFGIVSTAGLRLTERGMLRWREFAERPEDATVEFHFDPRLTVRTGAFHFELGYRLFSQDRYAYTGGVRTFRQGYTSSGPVASVEWMGTSERRVRIDGWQERQRLDAVPLATIPNVSVAVRLPL